MMHRRLMNEPFEQAGSKALQPEEPDSSVNWLSESQFYVHPWPDNELGPVEAWPAQLTQLVKLLLASVHPMFLLWGPRHILLFNGAFSRILGSEYGKALGAPVDDLWAPIWSRVGPLVEQVFLGGSGFLEDEPIPTWSSGFSETRFFSCSYSPILDLADEVAGALCIVTDRTENVRSQQNLLRERDVLHGMFEQAPGFIAMAEGPEHRFTFANAAYRRFVGQRRIIGETVAEVLPELVEQGIIEVLDETYRSGKPFTGKALPIKMQRHSDAEWEEVFVNIVYRPIKDGAGKVIGIFAEGYEVTEEKWAKEKVVALQSELIHMARVSAMGTMASTLAHELNQPLTAAENYLTGVQRLVAGNAGEARAVAGIADAKGQILRAGGIIRRLRDMVANRPSQLEWIKLRPLFEDVVALARLGGAVGEVPIDCEVEPSASLVHGDRIQIEQVLLNLLRNGAQSIGDSQDGRILLAARSESVAVRISVRDNGPGIGDVDPEGLFSAFGPSTSGGLGVGLSICRTIVEAHGGRIQACNNEDAGASFSFTLPVD